MKEAVRAIIKNPQNQILVGKRPSGMDAGKYTLIGGKIESGETPERAVMREVKEEVGLDFKPISFFTKINTASDPEDPWLTYYFVGTAAGDMSICETEVESIVYISLDDLQNLQFAFDHREVITNYLLSIS